MINDYESIMIIEWLRILEGNFTAKDLAIFSGMVDKLTIRGFRYYMNRGGYCYLHAR